MSGLGAQPLGSSGFGTGGVGPAGTRSNLLAYFVDRGAIYVELEEQVLSICPSSENDALNSASWNVVDDAGKRIPVMGVEPQGRGYVLQLWEPSVRVGEWSITLTVYIGSFGGYRHTNMYWQCLSTAASISPRRDTRRDLRSNQYIGSLAGGLVVTGGDYMLESGARLRKKLLIRRLSTLEGAFRHAPAYGSAPSIKVPYTAADLETLRTRIVQACLQEYEAERVEVTMSGIESGVVSCHVKVFYQGSSTAEVSARYGPDGAYLGGE